jgi:hypothetical protein
MFQCSKLPCLGWRSADFLQGFFHPKCLQEQLKHTCSSTKISMSLPNNWRKVLKNGKNGKNGQKWEKWEKWEK